MAKYLPPAYVVQREGNVLTHVCLSVHRGGVSPDGGSAGGGLGQSAGGGVSHSRGGGGWVSQPGGGVSQSGGGGQPR